MTETKLFDTVEDKYGSTPGMIIVGRKMEHMKEMMERTYPKGSLNFTLFKCPQNPMFFPFDDNGLFLMRAGILSDAIASETASILTKPVVSSDKIGYGSVDGSYTIGAVKRPLFIALLLDMARLRRYRSDLTVTHDKGILVCFDFAVPVLQDYFGDLAEIRAYPVSDFAEKFAISLNFRPVS